MSRAATYQPDRDVQLALAKRTDQHVPQGWGQVQPDTGAGHRAARPLTARTRIETW